jgi:hypothetical protein
VDYDKWAALRNMLLSVTTELQRVGSAAFDEFSTLTMIAHYLAMRSACDGVGQLREVATKVTVSLLRHTDLLCADRAFYEAGMACNQVCAPLAYSHLFKLAYSHLFKLAYSHLFKLAYSHLFKLAYSHLFKLAYSHLFKLAYSHLFKLAYSLTRFSFCLLSPVCPSLSPLIPCPLPGL